MPVERGSIQLFKVFPFCPKYQSPRWLGCCFSSKCVFYPRFIFFEIETFQCCFLSLLYPTFPDAHKEQYICRKRSLDDFFLGRKKNQESVCNLGNGVRVLKEENATLQKQENTAVVTRWPMIRSMFGIFTSRYQLVLLLWGTEEAESKRLDIVA